MKNSGKLLNTFSILIGIFLLIEGIWGLSSDVVFQVFTTNTTHAILHIILGIISIVLGFRKNANEFCFFLGLLLLVVGILRLIPGTSHVIIDVLKANEPVAYMNMALGCVALFLALTEKKSSGI